MAHMERRVDAEVVQGETKFTVERNSVSLLTDAG